MPDDKCSYGSELTQSVLIQWFVKFQIWSHLHFECYAPVFSALCAKLNPQKWQNQKKSGWGQFCSLLSQSAISWLIDIMMSVSRSRSFPRQHLFSTTNLLCDVRADGTDTLRKREGFVIYFTSYYRLLHFLILVSHKGSNQTTTAYLSRLLWICVTDTVCIVRPRSVSHGRPSCLFPCNPARTAPPSSHWYLLLIIDPCWWWGWLASHWHSKGHVCVSC